MKILKIAFTLLTVSIFYLPASAQNDVSVLNRIMDKTAKLYNAYPIEKVYLHFDKPYYAVGDTIWFKAYLTIDHHQPSLLSKIIYVDILGARDSLVQSLRLQVKNGVAWSSIVLSPLNYKKGNYRVMAYTNWMNNNDPAYFFNKNIAIGDAINNNISTQISLKTSGENKNAKIAAGIYYKDDAGNPFVDKKVSWTIQKDDETIFKGKGITDKDGFISIGFTNIKNYSLDSATMVTVLDNGSRKQFTSLFPLKSVGRPNDIQFFPEGGQLLVGLRTKIAFKTVKPNGLGIDLKGTVTDNEHNIVAEFTSSHLGMGVFVLTPVDGKTYTAKVTFADGSTAVAALPKIQMGGIVLGLDNRDPDMLRLKLQTDPSFFKAYEGKTFYILGKSGGVICYGAQTQLHDMVYSAAIPKSKFPTGIAQVTLFSDEGEPLSERIAFIQHNDMLNLALASDKPTYTTRQKVRLDLTAKNNGLPVEGNFSIAVIDDSKVPFDENEETTILTNLLLTSDIKGYIEKPNYYFNHPNDTTAANLDILLLTQGYRRFSYDGIMSNKFPTISFAPELGIDISGTLRASSGIPTKNGNVRLYIADKNYSENAVTDADGRFKFPRLVFSDSSKVVISARNNPRSGDLVLTLDGDSYQKIGPNFNRADEIMNIDSALSAYLKNSKVKLNSTHTLKEVVIKDTRIVKTVSHRDFGSLASLSSQPDHLIPGSMLKGCPVVLNCITSLANGMTFDQGNFYVTRDYNQGKRIPAQIFLRGTPVDAGTLSTINADDVESVELFMKDELGLINSAYGTNGAVVVNMKKMPETKKISLQELRELMPQKNEITFMPKGYAAVRTFYLPRYIGPRASQSTQTDTRSTIYWNPNITTDKTGTASFEYFNADGKGTYRAIIEGLDKDGNIGRQVLRYLVK
ncbi:MAG: TonB-dependent receptor plug domain-containing protein [Mucilaginibacter sp.]